MHGHIFQMSQSNVSKWVHLLHGALNYALSQQNLLPARTADELALRLQEEPPPSAAPTPLLSMTA
jgi:transposase, IS4 family